MAPASPSRNRRWQPAILIAIGVALIGASFRLFDRRAPSSTTMKPSSSAPPSLPDLFPGTPIPRRPRGCGENVDGAGRPNGHPRADKNCMIFIEGGTFRMGAQSRDPGAPGFDPDALPDEGPPHEVRVDPFWLSLVEVDVFLYRGCVRAGACPERDLRGTGGYDNAARDDRRYHPANGVTWEGAAAYCRFIGGRLPTEAEWELAARGPALRRYPWGDAPPGCPLANVAVEGREGCGAGATWEVATEREGAPGVRLRNMGGNVWEWVADWYAPYAATPQVNPAGPPTGTRKVQRGGAFTTTDPIELRATHRAALDPTLQLDDVGFRCAADAGVIRRN